jgi:zinc transport system substrate-binding protein
MRNSCSRIAMTCIAAGLLLTGCRDQSSSTPAVAVTSSYIECAVQDLLGAALPVSRLAEPGLCPGHFDMRPGQVNELQHARLLLRFDFQDSLDRQLGTIPSLSIAALSISGGMCVPESYLSTCRQSADALIRAGMLDSPTAAARLAAIEKRLAQTAATAQARVQHAGLAQRPVITSGHQAEFCRWLKLTVLTTLSGADTASIRQLDAAVAAARQAQCRLVIANRPEGTQLAERIAQELDGRMVVFDNFPDLTPGQSSFDAMLLDNVDRLVKAAP